MFKNEHRTYITGISFILITIVIMSILSFLLCPFILFSFLLSYTFPFLISFHHFLSLFFCSTSFHLFLTLFFCSTSPSYFFFSYDIFCPLLIQCTTCCVDPIMSDRFLSPILFLFCILLIA
jgi:hypothetical protein